MGKYRWSVEIEGHGRMDFDSKELAEGTAEEYREMYPSLIVEVTGPFEDVSAGVVKLVD